ncbi:hypothetical protein NUW54_g9106 [Trametes sanguinea]|uniref:Uncharacterized protein n=1 Tax=Trametes sanguinea TaxID=158606 RepID=A0ACC1PAU7_9APHY|nr:hypothetical protein NUW54_g9106 [Trametes sanguinea]
MFPARLSRQHHGTTRRSFHAATVSTSPPACIRHSISYRPPTDLIRPPTSYTESRVRPPPTSGHFFSSLSDP